jgi:hypothetical protein
MGACSRSLLTWLAQSLIDRYVIHTIFFDARVACSGCLFGALIGCSAARCPSGGTYARS